MVIECRNLIKKPSRISLPVEMVPLEQWYMSAVTVVTCILSTVVVATAIVPTVSRIKLLPTHYFLITITLPQGLRDLVRSHQKQSYGALFSCTNEALKKLALRYTVYRL